MDIDLNFGLNFNCNFKFKKTDLFFKARDYYNLYFLAICDLDNIFIFYVIFLQFFNFWTPLLMERFKESCTQNLLLKLMNKAQNKHWILFKILLILVSKTILFRKDRVRKKTPRLLLKYLLNLLNHQELRYHLVLFKGGYFWNNYPPSSLKKGKNKNRNLTVTLSSFLIPFTQSLIYFI